MNYAVSDSEAQSRYAAFVDVDPFPEIPPTLLSAEQVRKYVEKTGMVYPFSDDPKHMKVAAYEIALLGECVSWDAKGEKRATTLRQGDELVIEPNSITFVGLEPRIRLPKYIAARFNLKITHVYRGLLAGTGPLVDPGYDNKLFVPLHNLTTNSYVLVGGQPLVWMEFTKLHLDNASTASSLTRRFSPNQSLNDFLRKADPHRSIRSSIPESIGLAIASAERAERRISRMQIGGLIGLLLAAVGVVYPIVALQKDAMAINATAVEKLNEAKNTNGELLQTVKTLSVKIEALEGRLAKEPLTPGKSASAISAVGK